MKIKQNAGRVVYSPLSYVFQILEMGGSALQKYETTSDSFIPDRGLTPLVLQPSLIISDPDGVVATADYVAKMVNVSWVLTLMNGSTSAQLAAADGTTTNYAVDADTKKLTVFCNVPAGQVLRIHFKADYTDTRRGEVQHFEWQRDCGCEAQTDMNVTLDTGRWRGKVLLLAMKHWGQFGIPVQLMNGKAPVPDSKAVYQWQWWNEDARTWSEDFTEQAWLVGGEKTKEIIVDQDFIQKVILRVKATAYGNSATTKYWTTKMRRWYGQFDYDVEFLKGKYIFHDTDMVVLNAWVATAKGQLPDPCKYFDIELFFSTGVNGFESVGYGGEAVIRRRDLQGGRPRAGMLCRELTAMRAIALDDGSLLSLDDGSVAGALQPLFAQFPAKSREV